MKKNGFTLFELMIYLAISTVIMAAVYAAVVMAQRSSSSVGKKTLTQQDTRLVLDMMAMDIRNASYNRWHKKNIWLDQNGNLAANMVLAGIQIADQNNILVEMDINENGTIGSGPNEAVFYKYDGVDTITRKSNFAGGDQVLLGGAGNGTLVRNAQANVSLFQYFNGAGTDISATVVSSPTSATLGIPAIRRITITIVADTELSDLNTGAPKRMIYSTDVVVKNHAIASYSK